MDLNITPKTCLLQNLTDELLLGICDAVLGKDAREKDLKSLKALSQTNKYMRRFLVPEIFKSVGIKPHASFCGLLQTVQHLKASAIPVNVETCFWQVSPLNLSKT